MIIAPIQDMYTLLTRYEVRLPKDEVDAVSDLRYSWRKLNKQALEVADNLAKLQVRLAFPSSADSSHLQGGPHVTCD